MKSLTQLLFNEMLYSRSKDYMFQKVVAIIRSVIWHTLHLLYNCVAVCLISRFQHRGAWVCYALYQVCGWTT